MRPRSVSIRPARRIVRHEGRTAAGAGAGIQSRSRPRRLGASRLSAVELTAQSSYFAAQEAQRS